MPERVRKEYRPSLDQEPLQERVELSAPQEQPSGQPVPQLPQSLPPTVATSSPAAEDVAPQEQELHAIEILLSEGLDSVYNRMDKSAQQEFKKQGEITASQIQKILHGAKVQVQKIFSLVLTWLRLIPKVNKFFLEQEAKIKTDKIVALPHQN